MYILTYFYLNVFESAFSPRSFALISLYALFALILLYVFCHIYFTYNLNKIFILILSYTECKRTFFFCLFYIFWYSARLGQVNLRETMESQGQLFRVQSWRVYWRRPWWPTAPESLTRRKNQSDDFILKSFDIKRVSTVISGWFFFSKKNCQ